MEGIWIPLFVVLGLAAIGGLGYFLWKNRSKDGALVKISERELVAIQADKLAAQLGGGKELIQAPTRIESEPRLGDVLVEFTPSAYTVPAQPAAVTATAPPAAPDPKKEAYEALRLMIDAAAQDPDLQERLNSAELSGDDENLPSTAVGGKRVTIKVDGLSADDCYQFRAWVRDSKGNIGAFSAEALAGIFYGEVVQGAIVLVMGAKEKEVSKSCDLVLVNTTKKLKASRTVPL